MPQIPEITLNNGIAMPQIGLGVFKVEEGNQVEEAVRAALDAGYRSIDTAAMYGNEEGVGRAIKESGIPREELFITTKLWNDDQGYESAFTALQASLDKLDLEYLDLYLIHWPKPAQNKYKETWKAFEEMYTNGKIRAIGVSNFHQDHLDDLLTDAQVVPAVNQIEMHPMLIQSELREYCNQKGIAVEAWSPLMRGGELLEHPVISSIAQAHNKQPGQIVLRWHIQLGVIVIPKSVTPERIAANIDIFNFELTSEEMEQISSLHTGERTGPNPANF